jgi:hypothetical protein
MAGQDCDSTILLGGAVVYSHYINQSKSYNNEVNCQIKFKSKKSDWKIMLRMLEMDIPDRQKNGICNDALYVSDSDKMYHTMVSAYILYFSYIITEGQQWPSGYCCCYFWSFTIIDPAH